MVTKFFSWPRLSELSIYPTFARLPNIVITVLDGVSGGFRLGLSLQDELKFENGKLSALQATVKTFHSWGNADSRVANVNDYLNTVVDLYIYPNGSWLIEVKPAAPVALFDPVDNTIRPVPDAWNTLTDGWTPSQQKVDDLVLRRPPSDVIKKPRTSKK